MPCVLEVRWIADHGPVYSPSGALRLRSRLVAAREPLQPDFSTSARHFLFKVLTTTHNFPRERGKFKLGTPVWI